ncbi:type I-E CRISPR-associated protein Cas5/CasD [Streptomyces griseoflavus]|uniref:type I-E CRISPR-associated protein Cas5/CasD n=1 Tax=Streptomyces griseoflavus TaxID=35619 RepID=UPI0037F15380
MNRLVPRLAAPMQSGGEHSVFTPDGDTAPFPRRSALLGALAATQGITRQDTGALDRYAALEFTVRARTSPAAGEANATTVYDMPLNFALHGRNYGRRQLHRTGERNSLHLDIGPTPRPRS